MSCIGHQKAALKLRKALLGRLHNKPGGFYTSIYKHDQRENQILPEKQLKNIQNQENKGADMYIYLLGMEH